MYNTVLLTYHIAIIHDNRNTYNGIHRGSIIQSNTSRKSCIELRKKEFQYEF